MKNYKIYLQYFNACHFHDRIWFVDAESNDLFSMDIQSLSVQFNQKIPFLTEEVQYAYANKEHCCYDNKCILFPSSCNQILVYDVEQNDVQGIPFIPEDGSERYSTAGIIQYNDQVWILPHKLMQGVFLLDLETLKLERNFELAQVLAGVDYIYNIDNVVRMSETEVAILSGKHTIIGINIQEKKKTFQKDFDEDMNVWGIRYDGKNFWLLLYYSTDVYEWILNDDKLVKYTLLEKEWVNGKGVPYVNMIFVGCQIILLPCSLKYIMKIDKRTKTINKAIDYPKGFRFFNNYSMFPAFWAFDIIDDCKVLLHPLRGNMLLVYDIDKNQIEGRVLTVNSESVPGCNKKIRRIFEQKNNIIYENDEYELGMLDLAVCQNAKVQSIKQEQSIGEEIYNTLVRE